jgi:hypothetical protein
MSASGPNAPDYAERMAAAQRKRRLEEAKENVARVINQKYQRRPASEYRPGAFKDINNRLTGRSGRITGRSGRMPFGGGFR